MTEADERLPLIRAAAKSLNAERAERHSLLGVSPSPRKPQPPPTSWSIYKLAAKQTWLGFVEAATEAETVEKAAAEFGQYPKKVMAVRRPEARSSCGGR